MKKLKSIAGIASSLVIFIGCLFKTLHLPGTGPFLLTGAIIFLVAYVPLLIASTLKNKKNSGLTKFIYVLGYLMSSAFITSIIFKFLHLQFGIFIMQWSLKVLIFVVTPLFFYSVYTKIGKGRFRDRKLTEAIIVMAVLGLLYTLVDLRAM